MQDWEQALITFLKPWKEKKEVVGALVCGSFVAGNPTKHSDIDVHIVLKDGTQWRERGNVIINGFLIEYFANPPKQIIQYFKDDYKNKRQMAVVQFLTGKILFDDGTIKELQQEAKKWYGKKFPKQSTINKELSKYALWDMMDNLQDAFEQNNSSFWFIYHNMLNTLIGQYCNVVGYPVIKEYKALALFTDKKRRDKYLLRDFPDTVFKQWVTKAILAEDKPQAMQLYRKLTNHVLNRMSGFAIDGWKIRSPLDDSCK